MRRIRSYVGRCLSKVLASYHGSIGTSNESTRKEWLSRQLASIPAGHRILDAGAGQLRWKKCCEHLDYVSQDFARWQNGALLGYAELTQTPAVDLGFALTGERAKFDFQESHELP